MTTPTNPVVIVGAGPVGVVCALLLARRGIASVILERHREPYALPRAVHLDDEVFRILQAIGIADEFAPQTRPMPGMRLVDGRGRVMTEFTRDTGDGRNGFPPDSMFDQPDLERILLHKAAEVDLIDVRRGCQVTEVSGGARPVVCYRDLAGTTAAVDAVAVIGCDGANSAVRAQLGITMRDFRFDERWLVVDVLTPAPLDVWSGVHQICDAHRAATFMPVTGNRYRWEFRVHGDEDLDALRAEDSLRQLLSPWLSPTALAESEIMRHASYTFRARVAHTWRNGSVFLAGDAAHQTPPFVGQGLGSGLRDAFNLTWKLADVLDGVAQDSLLDTYESERKPHATRIIVMALVVGWGLTGGQDRLASIRRALVAAACHIPRIASALPDASPALSRGPLVRRRGFRSRLNGTLFPQPWVRTPDGARRLDDLLGTGYALITRGPLRDHAAYRPAANGLTHVDVDALTCVPSSNPSPSAVMRSRHTHAVLLRPDRVVMASARTSADVGELLSAYQRVHCTDLEEIPV
ncbi:bifunctional 3-(3-hydroxy-phenyl)propionate/3-hydroxycinnamic acid hydroxylase MhpA [Gordonia rubripertincta]|uniref:Bifunctional 3-(3-hydroxy-phenyl)propionate/3-hydroxycinnamic acid hydroxylase n=1 Tax=Gordonia rubripertincta TaxID=36822 RepID=A0ABT4MWT1_GORRU|nr:bifunctional 3-(3-hydroxy-phenyl)propionate/3-hydroxycinnamic acid hydroxylase [Gordonia rubripertincta]MCZ4551451.1 bifunctional 3-(3-hydroxy-phenyl)propionate/3-hydroxycinnamic acid hydroxylase [Gordonia rubripertincta]